MSKQPEKKESIFKRLRYPVIAFPAIIFPLVVILGFVDGGQFVTTLNTVFSALTKALGWLVGPVCAFITIGVAVVALGPWGKIRFGGPKAKPHFSTWNWFAIALCGGIGTGIMFWGVTEPLLHTMAPPSVLGLEPGSDAAMRWAMRAVFMHWTLTPYCLYSLAGITIAYAIYNLKKPYTVSSGLTLLNNGKDLNKKLITLVDGLALLALIGGIAGSLGYGIMQLGDAAHLVFGVETGPVVWAVIAIIIVVSYTISSVSGLDKGIKWLSDKNAWIFMGLLVFVAICGPTLKIFNFFTQSVGEYVNHFFTDMTFTDPFGTEMWPQWWDIYYLLDWLAATLLMGLFLSKLCYGRTIREFALVNVLLPGVFGMVWFAVFGGFGLNLQFHEGVDLFAFYTAHGAESLMFKAFDYLPLTKLIRPVIMITIMLSFITYADSMTSTISLMSLKDSDNEKEAPMGLKIVWGVILGATAYICVLNGGLDSIKAVKSIFCFPIVAIVFLLMVGLLKYMSKYGKDLVKAEEAEREKEKEDISAAVGISIPKD